MFKLFPFKKGEVVPGPLCSIDGPRRVTPPSTSPGQAFPCENLYINIKSNSKLKGRPYEAFNPCVTLPFPPTSP